MKLRLLSLLCALSALSLTAARAQDPAPPGLPLATVVTTPAQPGTPAPAAPAAQVPAPVLARREDADPSAPPAQPAPVNADLNLIQRAVAALTGIPTNTAAMQSATALQSQVASLTQQIATLTTERDAARAELTTLRAGMASLSAALENPAAAAGTPAGAQVQSAITNQVSHELRSIGVPAATLPKPASSPQAQTLDGLQAQLDACKTPAERQALLAKNKDLILRSN